MNKFWRFNKVTNADEKIENILTISGYIAQESWFMDDVTPQVFKSELSNYTGDVTVWINSPGGDFFASSEIYTALKEHNGSIHVKIDGIAASAASVIAMAGDMVEMSPTAMMMVHNPALSLYGQVSELERGIEFLNEVKEAIINAYQMKTGLSRAKIAKLMDAESWFNTKAAMDMGLCDRMLYTEDKAPPKEDVESFTFNKLAFVTNTVSAMKSKLKTIEKPKGVDIAQFETRLNLLSGR